MPQEVADETQTEPGRRRGRPLDPAREEAILDAVWELLEEVGYDQMTVKDVASRAGAGLGAIYRRWPTKVELTIAAVQASCGRGLPRPTGDVEIDLARLMTAEAQRFAANEHRLIGFLGAMRSDCSLADAVRESLVLPTYRAYVEILSGVFEDPVECGLRAEMALAMTLQRMLFEHRPTKTEIRRLFVPLILGRPLPD